MDLALLVAWEWFQWIAIRLAVFMGLLTLGPSIGLIVFDLVLYAYRTIFGKMVLLGERKGAGKEMRVSIVENTEEVIAVQVESAR
jgi:hypothetical protein